MFSLFADFSRCSLLNVSSTTTVARRSFVHVQKVLVDFQVNSQTGQRINLCSLININRRSMASLETLQFDNLALRTLPIDPVKENFVRQVNNSCFSMVDPTPVNNPKLVIHSQTALDILDLGQEEVERPEFTEYFSGNKKLLGSETASHCYCGHQFGSFAGQLGDGAAIYLGEVLNSHGERWEIQLKGAGRTPYSRSADGRKVLRSSIREFLCSEAMHHLGIPTTRAGSCITSDTKVVRDIFYDGNPIYEKSSIILRISPTFIRFGSFEIFKQPDMLTGRRGPSAGKHELLIQLLEYVIKTFYPNINETHSDNTEERYLAFFKEVVLRTARMVSEWQCVGFCHGVLNTDNMSILGLTIDYGPFGFMDHFDSGYASNASDDTARYSYKEQPEICKWNLSKLAEALSGVLPVSKSKNLLEEMYDKEFMKCYINKMRRKLGIIHKENPNDSELIERLLQTMQETGADFTNVFRCLSKIKITDSAEFEKCNEEVLTYILSQCISPSDMPSSNSVSSQLQLLMMMINSNPTLGDQLRGNPLIQAERERMEKAKKLQEATPEEKLVKDRETWLRWMEIYRQRIMEDFSSVGMMDSANEERVNVMNNNNPRFVLRNYIAETAIKAAENGDYSLVKHVLEVLQTPYSNGPLTDIGSKGEATTTTSNVTTTPDCNQLIFDNKPPKWGLELRVT